MTTNTLKTAALLGLLSAVLLVAGEALYGTRAFTSACLRRSP